MATCSATGYGVYTCQQSCTGGGTSTSTFTCVMGSNLTNGSFLYVVAGQPIGTAITSVTGCGLTWTLADTSITNEIHATAPNSGTGACTVSINWSASVTGSVAGVEILGTTQTIDKSGKAFPGTINSPNPINSPSITTTVNGDLVLGSAIDVSGSAVTYSSGTGTIFVQSAINAYNVAIQGQVQSSAGAIQPNMTANLTGGYETFSMSFEAPAAPPAPPEVSNLFLTSGQYVPRIVVGSY